MWSKETLYNCNVYGLWLVRPNISLPFQAPDFPTDTEIGIHVAASTIMEKENFLRRIERTPAQKKDALEKTIANWSMFKA